MITPVLDHHPYTLSDLQRSTWHEWRDEDIIQFMHDGGSRSGKTFNDVKWIVERAATFERSRHLLCRYRFKHAKSSLWRQTLLPMLSKLAPGGGYHVDKVDYIVTFKHNGSEIWLGGLDDKDRTEKILGEEYVSILLDEASQVSFSSFQMLLTRLSQVIPGLPIKMALLTNPRNKFHWLYQYFILRRHPLDPSKKLGKSVYRRGPWLPTDNPFLADKYIHGVLDEMVGAAKMRFRKGLWTNVEGLVYPEFEDAIVDPFTIPSHWPIYGAVDFGYTNPFCFLWIAHDVENETFYIIDERYESDVDINEHCDALLSKKDPKPKCKWIVADHDAGDRSVMAKRGLKTIAAQKLKKEYSIRVARTLLEAKRGLKLRVFRTCTDTIDEAMSYSYPEAREGKDKSELPVEVNNHAMDDIAYFSREIDTRFMLRKKKKFSIGSITKTSSYR